MSADILIVDDEADIRLLISGILEDDGYRTRQAAGAEQALDEVRARAPSIILLDIWLEGSSLNGLELLEVIHKLRPHTPIIMISGHGTIETAVDAIKRGAYDFIEKPFEADRLMLASALVSIIAARSVTRPRLSATIPSPGLTSTLSTVESTKKPPNS